jgi:hypothetical protein
MKCEGPPRSRSKLRQGYPRIEGCKNNNHRVSRSSDEEVMVREGEREGAKRFFGGVGCISSGIRSGLCRTIQSVQLTLLNVPKII